MDRGAMDEDRATGRDRPYAEALAAAGWASVQDRLVGGLCHDLNGRASSLGGLVTLASLGGDEEIDVPAMVEEEIAKLERLTGLLRLLGGDPDGPPEPLVLGDLLPRVLALRKKTWGAREVSVGLDVDASTPPVLVGWSLLGRIVLLVVSEAVEGCGEAEGEAVRLVVDEHDGGARVTVRCSDAAGAEEASPEPPAWTPLARALERDGIRLETAPDPGGGALARLHLPSLAEARARAEGAGGG